MGFFRGIFLGTWRLRFLDSQYKLRICPAPARMSLPPSGARAAAAPWGSTMYADTLYVTERSRSSALKDRFRRQLQRLTMQGDRRRSTCLWTDACNWMSATQRPAAVATWLDFVKTRIRHMPRDAVDMTHDVRRDTIRRDVGTP